MPRFLVPELLLDTPTTAAASLCSPAAGFSPEVLHENLAVVLSSIPVLTVTRPVAKLGCI